VHYPLTGLRSGRNTIRSGPGFVQQLIGDGDLLKWSLDRLSVVAVPYPNPFSKPVHDQQNPRPLTWRVIPLAGRMIQACRRLPANPWCRFRGTGGPMATCWRMRCICINSWYEQRTARLPAGARQLNVCGNVGVRAYSLTEDVR
jgi:hypothetical protein